MNITSGVAAEINRHNALAHENKDRAVGHAREAGLLLLKVKASLPHGEFLPWLLGNVSFSARNAQRYMNLAAPRPKCDRLSYSRPNLTKAGERRLQQLERAGHRDDLIAHALLLVAELPNTDSFREADVETLRALARCIDSIVGVPT